MITDILSKEQLDKEIEKSIDNPSTTMSTSTNQKGAGENDVVRQILPDTHQVRFLITEDTLKEYDDKWCGVMALIDLYGYEQENKAAVEKPRKSKTTKEMVLIEETDEKIVYEQIIRSRIEVKKNDNRFKIMFRPPSKLTAIRWGEILSCTRQAAAKVKMYADELVDKGIVTSYAGVGGYSVLTTNQIRWLRRFVFANFLFQNQRSAWKVVMYMIFNAMKFKKLGCFRNSVKTVCDKTGVGFDVANKVVHEMCDDRWKIMERPFVGNGQLGIGSTYRLTKVFENLGTAEYDLTAMEIEDIINQTPNTSILTPEDLERIDAMETPEGIEEESGAVEISPVE